MKRSWMWLSLIGLGVLGGLTFVWAEEKKGEEKEQKVTIEQVPAKVKAAIHKYAGSNAIKEISKEAKHGTDIYEASWMVGEMKQEVELAADGSLLELEEKVDAADVPEAVQKAAAKALEGATKITYVRKTIVMYEARTKADDGKKREVLIQPTGKLVHKEGAGKKEEHKAGKEKKDTEKKD